MALRAARRNLSFGASVSTVFYLLGFPGVGKYTVAKEISRLTGAKIVDNHYVLNPIFGLIEQDGVTPLPPKVWDYAWQVHDAVSGVIRELSPRSWSFVFTNAIVDGDPESDQLFAEVAEIARLRESLFVPVRLLAEVEELQRRVVRPERRERMKAASAEEARKIHAQHEVYKPDHPNTLTLDVTNLPPGEVAGKILAHAERLRFGFERRD